MPNLDIDMFDDTPKVGDKVKVLGKVKFIDDDTGEVEVSYDDVSIVRKKKKRNRDDDDDDIDFSDNAGDRLDIFMADREPQIITPSNAQPGYRTV